MNIIRLPLSEIKKPERNVRIHTEKQLQEFARSITMFGQIRPIVIDEDNTILAGAGCYETLMKLERTEGDFYKVEGLSENQKKKLMITDNKIFGLGIDDLDTFNTFLDELQNDLDIPGYDEDILLSMVAVADEVTEKIGEYGTIDEEEIAAISASRERKEKLMSSPPVEPSVASEPNHDTTPVHSGETTEPQAETTTDIKRHVACPKCGEKIWL